MLLSSLARRVSRRYRRRLLCREAVELMTHYLEGAMSAGERRRFESHLSQCTACVLYLEQMRATIAALGHLRPRELPTAVVDELVELYRRHRAG